MKILWVNTNFMHPTTKGGQIRTLEMLRHLHRRHEIHYVAIENPQFPEGPARAGEYSTRCYPFQFSIPDKRSPAFLKQLAAGLISPVPLAVSRFCPPGMGAFLEDLIRRERFDRAVVDHLAPTSYFPRLNEAIFFQHNVETVIWRRHVEHASGMLRRFYFRLQAGRMYEYERRVSRASGRIVAVSAVDAGQMRSLFQVDRVSEIPTGVNLEDLTPSTSARRAGLVFIGSMDWLPNIDGVLYFVREVLPLIRQRRADCALTIVGRAPTPEIAALAKRDPLIQVTGTVPDIRPYLWTAAASIVPLRIGGGTRLKIYESMAARTPVVSTTIGAEGLEIDPPRNIRIADTPAAFAADCCELLASPAECERLSAAAWDMVSTRFSWEAVSRCFERILELGPPLSR